jgi:hypothetical protein
MNPREVVQNLHLLLKCPPYLAKDVMLRCSQELNMSEEDVSELMQYPIPHIPNFKANEVTRQIASASIKNKISMTDILLCDFCFLRDLDQNKLTANRVLKTLTLAQCGVADAYKIIALILAVKRSDKGSTIEVFVVYEDEKKQEDYNKLARMVVHANNVFEELRRNSSCYAFATNIDDSNFDAELINKTIKQIGIAMEDEHFVLNEQQGVSNLHDYIVCNIVFTRAGMRDFYKGTSSLFKYRVANKDLSKSVLEKIEDEDDTKYSVWSPQVRLLHSFDISRPRESLVSVPRRVPKAASTAEARLLAGRCMALPSTSGALRIRSLSPAPTSSDATVNDEGQHVLLSPPRRESTPSPILGSSSESVLSVRSEATTIAVDRRFSTTSESTIYSISSEQERSLQTIENDAQSPNAGSYLISPNEVTSNQVPQDKDSYPCTSKRSATEALMEGARKAQRLDSITVPDHPESKVELKKLIGTLSEKEFQKIYLNVGFKLKGDELFNVLTADETNDDASLIERLMSKRILCGPKHKDHIVGAVWKNLPSLDAIKVDNFRLLYISTFRGGEATHKVLSKVVKAVAHQNITSGIVTYSDDWNNFKALVKKSKADHKPQKKHN